MKRRNVVSIVVSTAIVLVAAALVLPSLNRTNCGGNSAALAACRAYILFLQTWSADHPGEAFRLDRADAETLHDLSHLPGTEDLRAARLLAARGDVRINPAAAKRIILVCDHAFDNVPRRWWGRAPMTHAAAYSTGEVGLMTSQEFARLNITNFVDLIASNTGEPRVSHPWLFSPMPDVSADADNPFTLTRDKHFAAVIALDADIRRDLYEVLKQLAAVVGALQPGQDMTVTVVYRDQSHRLSVMPTGSDNTASAAEIERFCQTADGEPMMSQSVYPWVGLLNAMGPGVDQGFFLISATDLADWSRARIMAMVPYVRDGRVRKEQRINCSVWLKVKDDFDGSETPVMAIARGIAEATGGRYKVCLYLGRKRCQEPLMLVLVFAIFGLPRGLNVV